MTTPPRVWAGALLRLGAEMPALVFDTWVRPLVASEGGDELCLGCRGRFHLERVRERHLEQIERAVSVEAGRPVRLRLALTPSAGATGEGAQDSRAAEVRDRAEAPTSTAAAHLAKVVALPDARSRRAEQVGLPGTYGFDSFVVGPSNALAREAAHVLARASRPGLSQVFVAAPEGLGKTHLAKAVASTASGRAGIRAVYVSAESFTNQFTSSLRARRTEEFKRRYRETCDLLVVEDLDFVAGKAQTQLELFHTIEHLLETGRRVFLTSSRLPREIEGLDARLQSRLTSGLVAEIDPPDAALRRAILLAKAASGGFRLPADCADRLVEAAPNSVRDLVGVLTQLVSMAALLKRPIDRELTEAALRKVTPASAPRRSLSPSDVVEAVCSSLGTTPAVLGSRTRRRDVLAPRQVAMYLCRRFTDASLSEIGALFGRDHPAVANAVAVVERGLLERAPLRYQVEALSQKLDMLARGAGAGAVRSGVSSQRP